MPKLAKRRKHNEAIAPKTTLPVRDAISTVKKFKAPKFDQSLNIVMHLSLDVKQADQALRGSVALPNGIGKSKRVVAFCAEDKAPAALEAGAVKAGGADLVEEIEKGWMDFDVAVATPDMMRVISKLGRVLGPKGLMPSPKAGTVTPNVVEAVKEYAAGKLEYRADKGGNIHGVLGKLSFDDDALVQNFEHFVDTILKARPSTTKGQYVKKITISGTMTPGIQIAHEALAAQ
jgi:large subunit ribosomal protein L1